MKLMVARSIFMIVVDRALVREPIGVLDRNKRAVDMMNHAR